MSLEPSSPELMAEAIRANSRVLAVGGRTKPRLSRAPAETVMISTRGLRGMVEYDPGEFTFTALAGTPVREISEVLAAQGQYLPFDPVLTESGATLGGTVAAGLNGPGRLRFGGIRDFILAVQFADGRGQLIRGGAKVVKNAAGFDIPKFLVGSLGRFGVLVELTFKVFPRPAGWTTLKVPTALADVAPRISEGAAARWELDALEYDDADGAVYARIGGPAEANAALAGEIMQKWTGAAVLPEDAASAFWREAGEFAWAGASKVVAKVPLTLGCTRDVLEAVRNFEGARARISGAASTAWIALADRSQVTALDASLRELGLRGMVILGEDVPLFLGRGEIERMRGEVERVFDPERRFAPF